MRTKHSRDVAANANDVITLPSSVKAVLYHGTVLIHKDWAKALLQMGFGSLSCIGVGGPVCDSEGEISAYSLILHDEEALYLCEVGILAVRICGGDNMVDSAYLLKFFTEKRSTFPLFYKTYNYFKSRGFVVRPGMNFGMDYSIYRLNPTKCHSEICVQVIDGRKSGEDIDPLLSWRNISTLTRVMPDVMKMCILCFVYNKDNRTNSAEPSSFNYLDLLDSQEEPSSGSTATLASLDNLVIKPVSFVIRRLSVNAEKYLNVSQIQSRYRSSSKLYMPRTTVRSTKVQSMKVNKKRRDHLEVRAKNAKGVTVWKVLDQNVVTGDDEGNKEDCMDEDL